MGAAGISNPPNGGIPHVIVCFLYFHAALLLCIIKIKLNPFVALLVCAYGTGLLVLATYAGVGAPEGFSTIADVTACVTGNFGSTLGSIGIVTGLGVMLGMFMYESGGIDSIVDKVLKTVGPKRSQYAVSVAGFITGIPVFGDVVYIMFAPMLRVLSRKTGYSMAAYGGALAIATTCTFALVLPTAPPLAVAGLWASFLLCPDCSLRRDVCRRYRLRRRCKNLYSVVRTCIHKMTVVDVRGCRRQGEPISNRDLIPMGSGTAWRRQTCADAADSL